MFGEIAYVPLFVSEAFVHTFMKDLGVEGYKLMEVTSLQEFANSIPPRVEERELKVALNPRYTEGGVLRFEELQKG
jgi:hypothetical protein